MPGGAWGRPGVFLGVPGAPLSGLEASLGVTASDTNFFVTCTVCFIHVYVASLCGYTHHRETKFQGAMAPLTDTVTGIWHRQQYTVSWY